jgi:magnesium transporter
MRKRGVVKLSKIASAKRKQVSEGKKLENVKIAIFDYNKARFEEKTVERIEECFEFKDKQTVTWINIDALHDAEAIKILGKYYDVHPLIVEDILNTDQRPKIDVFDKYILIVLKMLYFDEVQKRIIPEHMSIILGPNYVISFQEKEGDVFDNIRDKIRNNKGRVRVMGADYLAYLLIDAVINNYFSLLEQLGEKIEAIEDALMTNPTQETLKEIYSIKREMLYLRKAVWPLRDVSNQLEKSESNLIKEKTVIYLQDLYDSVIQAIDTIETYRDMIALMLEIYLSSISNKLNEVMKVLTVISTIFIPLTFLVGVYGMNFRYVPEFELRWAYPVLWIIMATIGISMFIYFKRKKWV